MIHAMLAYVIHRACASLRSRVVNLNPIFSPHHTPSLPAPPLPHLSLMWFLLFISLRNIQPQPISIKIQLILPARLLQNRRNIPCILNPSEVHITPALLDRISDEFGGAGFTLGANDRGLFFLAGFVDDEGGALGFLLGYLFGFYCGGEFGGEGEVLDVDLVKKHLLGGK